MLTIIDEHSQLPPLQGWPEKDRAVMQGLIGALLNSRVWAAAQPLVAEDVTSHPTHQHYRRRLAVLSVTDAEQLLNICQQIDPLLHLISQRRADNTSGFVGSDLARIEPLLRVLLSVVRGDKAVETGPGGWDGQGERPIKRRGVTLLIALAAHEVMYSPQTWRTACPLRIVLPEDVLTERVELAVVLPDGTERTPTHCTTKLVAPSTIRLTAEGPR